MPKNLGKQLVSVVFICLVALMFVCVMAPLFNHAIYKTSLSRGHYKGKVLIQEA